MTYDDWRLMDPPYSWIDDEDDDDEQRLTDEELAAEIADRMEDDWRGP